MSNYALQAEVSRLRSELNQIESENNALRAEIGSAVSSVNQADRNLSEYNQHIRNTLDNANGSINNSINRALAAYELQGQIDQLYTRYKAVELANKRIRALNNKKYYDFNNYRTIRKIVQGMLDNLDVNMVSDAVIYKSVEKQHLLTPDYWLTSVLISIMAWRSDDKRLAERAIEVSYKLDKKNSSIFYMIFNMRMDRNAAAIKWFLEYQKCDLKGSDENTFLMLFSLISKTLTDSVDDETAAMVSDYIHNLVLEHAKREGYNEDDIVAQIRQKMTNMTRTGEYQLPMLAKYCSEYDSMRRMLDLAKNNYNILEFLLKIINVSVAERNTYLKEYINDLLAKPNEVEQDTYDQIDYNELVIRMSGDVDGAKARFQEQLDKREADFNIIQTIISWVYDMGNEDISGQMRLNMFTLTKTLQTKAADTYFANYRSMYNNTRSITIQDYSTSADLTNEGQESNKIDSFYSDKQTRELSTVKDLPAYLAFGAGALCGVAAIFLSLYLLIGTAIGGIAGAGILVSNVFKKKNIMLSIQSQKQSANDILHKLCEEYRLLQDMYKEYDDISRNISDELAKL